MQLGVITMLYIRMETRVETGTGLDVGVRMKMGSSDYTGKKTRRLSAAVGIRFPWNFYPVPRSLVLVFLRSLSLVW